MTPAAKQMQSALNSLYLEVSESVAKDVAAKVQARIKELERRAVFVVMGNDHPAAVFSTEAAAEEFCAAKKHDGNTRIYWRVYEFTLDVLLPVPSPVE